jgi:hypothetical protein
VGVATENLVTQIYEGTSIVTTIIDISATGIDFSSAGTVNARCEPIYLRGEGFELTARQIVFCLAAHLRFFGDTLDPKIVDPLTAIDAHMRFDGDFTGWTRGRDTHQVALLLARAEHIARDYFGNTFPILPW